MPEIIVEKLKPVLQAENVATSSKSKADEKGRYYATGRRKTASARVWIKPGTGSVTVNGKAADDYFARPVLGIIIRQPLAVVKADGQFDIEITVKGSGLTGQAGAVRHGITRALANYNLSFRPPLKKAGFLTRDSREVERKKCGSRKARKKEQYSKR